MSFEKYIKNAYCESVDDKRFGDKEEEIKKIREYILSADKIYIPNWNDVKVKSINSVLKKYGIKTAKHVKCDTKFCDLTRMPAISKAKLAIDTTDCDLVIARGRLGLPGSGSLLVIMDNKSRILTASISPPHVIHKKDISDAIKYEIKEALERIGFKEYD